MRAIVLALVFAACAKTSLDQLAPFACPKSGFCPATYTCVLGTCELTALDGPCQVTGLGDPCAAFGATCLISNPATMTGMCVAACVNAACPSGHACVGATDLEMRSEAACVPVTDGLCPVIEFQPTSVMDVNGVNVQACVPTHLPGLDEACGSSLACAVSAQVHQTKATECLYGTCVPEAHSPTCIAGSCDDPARVCVKDAVTPSLVDIKAGCFATSNTSTSCPNGDVTVSSSGPLICVARSERIDGVPCLFDGQCMYGGCDKDGAYKACGRPCGDSVGCSAGFVCDSGECKLDSGDD